MLHQKEDSHLKQKSNWDLLLCIFSQRLSVKPPFHLPLSPKALMANTDRQLLTTFPGRKAGQADPQKCSTTTCWPSTFNIKVSGSLIPVEGGDLSHTVHNNRVSKGNFILRLFLQKWKPKYFFLFCLFFFFPFVPYSSVSLPSSNPINI